jgi:benzoylformate decarboxylase
MAVSGIEAFLEMLAGCGVRYVFGNPGTTELPLNDALVADRRFQYVLGLQEVAVTSMADGYAMASRTPGVVNLHICCGLGHAMGILYNAHREGTPLIVTAGQQDRRLAFEEPILGGDMVSVARPWTKWACEVRRIQDLPSALRRAVQAALTPPTGPVFLSIPIDVQMERAGDLDLTPITLPNARFHPAPESITAAARTLLGARKPAILAGSRVRELGASNELIAVAESLGAPVFSEPGHSHGRLSFPSDHPLCAQGLPLWSPEIRERLKEFDALLVIGADLLRQYVYHEPCRAIPEHIKIVHVDEDAYQLNKNYACEVAVLGHAQPALQDLQRELQQQMTERHRTQAQQRQTENAAKHRTACERVRAEVTSQRDVRPLTPLALMGALADVLPRDIALIEEAVTTTNTTFERLGVLGPEADVFGHRGWALGWGMGVAIGAKLAWPTRPVLALIGDGAAGYGMQALWSAARYQVPVTFVICNNAQYQILKIGAQGFQLPHATANEYEGLDVVGPEIDFVQLAQSLGVEAIRITDFDELREATRQSFAREKPLLIDVPIARETPSRLNYG